MMASYLRAASKSRLITNYVYYLTDFGLRIGVQIVYFIIISRALGAASYGIFASISTIGALMSYFAALGSEQTLMRRTSGRPHEVPTAFGHSLVCLSLSVLPAGLVCYCAVKFVLHSQASPWAIVAIIAAEVFFGKFTGLASAAYISQEMAQRQSVINVVVSVIKLVGAVLAWKLTSPLSIESWAIYYCVSTAVGAMFAVTLVTYDLGRARFAFYPKEISDGLQFAVEMSSNAALRDFDKPLVVYVLGPEIGGLYAAASRLIETAAVPINAFAQTTYARYFQHARTGHDKAVEFGLRVLPIAVVLAIVISISLLTMAWVVPLILGPSYQGVVPLIQWLAVYPIVVAIYGTGSDLLRSFATPGPRLKVVIVSVMIYLPACYVGAVSAGAVGVTVARSCIILLLALIIWRVILNARHKY
jgi:O-antigen/teichoic acid export membrane protein